MHDACIDVTPTSYLRLTSAYGSSQHPNGCFQTNGRPSLRFPEWHPAPCKLRPGPALPQPEASPCAAVQGDILTPPIQPETFCLSGFSSPTHKRRNESINGTRGVSPPVPSQDGCCLPLAGTHSKQGTMRQAQCTGCAVIMDLEH